MAAAEALDWLTRCPAFALIHPDGAAEVTALGGRREVYERLADVPIEDGPPAVGRPHDRLLCIPFAQIRERGFAARQDGTPLVAIAAERQADIGVADLLAALPTEPVERIGPAGFATDDATYAELVAAVIRDEIGRGEGANLVVARSFDATIAGWGTATALTVFRRLLEQELGAYWTFLVFTGDRYLIGASPERHVSVHGSDVRMNPISGTFRLDEVPDPEQRKSALLSFLADEKEIFELFMVVDEELKMMCEICDRGGRVLGPFLKPMSHLVHTEYLLAGTTSKDLREVLRRSMFAATVTGSPVENACRLIERYEPVGRGYYSGALALVGRDPAGRPTVDSPIVLRTAEVGLDGRLRVLAGATLVRDSVPEREVAETHAKAAGILTALGLAPPAPRVGAGVPLPIDDPTVQTALARRNSRLGRFWLSDQSGTPAVPSFTGRRALVIDAADDFVSMLAHLLRVLGLETTIRRYDEYRPADLEAADLVVVGPGPGDPRDLTVPKIAALRWLLEDLLAAERPFLAVCLGHQVLCGLLGLELGYKDVVFQGTQSEIKLAGASERVAFYNTFVAREKAPGSLPESVSVDRDRESGDVHAIRGPHFAGVQFHAESILTQRGLVIVRDLVSGLLDLS